jgi:hypothetical protein
MKYIKIMFVFSFLAVCTQTVDALDVSIGSNATTVDSARSRGVTVGEFNGDDVLDIYVGNRTQQNQVWLSDGLGDYTQLQIVGDVGTTHAVLSGDVDGDGDIDLYSINAGGGAQNKLWINDGGGNFTNDDIVGDATNSYGGVMGDVDGDDDLDIYIANLGGAQNKLWINDGSGNFTADDIVGDTGNSTDAVMVDVDGDDDLDIYTANFGQNKLWINDGSGNFTADDIVGDTSNTYGVTYGDVDGDGDMDLYAANDGGQQNQLWINDGSGNFTAQNIIGDTGTSRKAAFGDLDGDDDLDLYVVNSGQNKLWINDGSGNFINDDIVGDSFNSHAVALFDYDNNGTLDIFVANDATRNQLWINNEVEPEPSDDVSSERKTQRIRYVCKNSNAENYNPTPFGRHLSSTCIFAPTILNTGIDGTPETSSLVLTNQELGETITFTIHSTYCRDIQKAEVVLESSLGEMDTEHMYPFGLVNFDIACEKKGESAEVTIIYSKKYNTDNWQYRKFNPSTDTYTDITKHVVFGERIVNNRLVTTLSYTVRDGDGIFDTDGKINGTIQDPSGSAILVSALPFAAIDTHGVIYLCKDPRAHNYTLANIGQHNPEACEFDRDLVVEDILKPTPRCEQAFMITQNLHMGLSDGMLYKNQKISQIALLQSHINNVLNQYTRPAGIPDGIFGKQTRAGVTLLQEFLNDVIYPNPQLIIDGVVGQETRKAMNAICPAVEV